MSCVNELTSQQLYVTHVLFSVTAADALDGFEAFVQCLHAFVMRRDARSCDLCVLELHRVAESFASRVFYVTLVCAIVFGRSC